MPGTESGGVNLRQEGLWGEKTRLSLLMPERVKNESWNRPSGDVQAVL